MLTLTRKIGESVRIGDDIRIVVKEIRGKQVRLGIAAPREVYVCREELYRKIQLANAAAAGGGTGALDALGLFRVTPRRPPAEAPADQPSGEIDEAPAPASIGRGEA